MCYSGCDCVWFSVVCLYVCVCVVSSVCVMVTACEIRVGNVNPKRGRLRTQDTASKKEFIVLCQFSNPIVSPLGERQQTMCTAGQAETRINEIREFCRPGRPLKPSMQAGRNARVCKKDKRPGS